MKRRQPYPLIDRTAMRHRRKGRKLGRNPNHQRALLRNLASALLLTERDAEFDSNAPKVKGRIVTTLHKAKEVRPLVEKCVTIARRSLRHQEAADQLETDADRGTDQWRSWRQSEQWQEWNKAIAPVVAARRRALRLLGDKQAVEILFDEIGPRFAERNGGYTRVLKLATPRLGDAGAQAILEFVGVRDRVSQKSEKPAFDDDEIADEATEEEVVDEAPAEEGEQAATEEESEEAKEE
jgi:large subunit ribosomal protein L17